MSALTVTGVSKAFGDTLAVDDVSLHVPHGSLTAVLGPSGCGKTTLLRLIAGFLAPDAGTIAFDDRVVAGAGRPVPPQDRRVGYVPQEGALFPHLDVAANIGFGLPRGERAAGARIDEMLDLVELPRTFRGRAPHELSGGQQQRVALARALAPRPDRRPPRRALLLPGRLAARVHGPGRRAGPAGRAGHRPAGHPRPVRGAVPLRPGRRAPRRAA